MLAFDTETCLIGPGLLAPPLVCVSTSGGGDGHLHHWTDEGYIEGLFVDCQDLVGHNVAYDTAVIASEHPRLLPKIFRSYDDDQITDTKIRQKLLDIAGGVYRKFTHHDGKVEKIGYSLQDLVKRHLGVHLEKTDTWRLRYGELRCVPLEAWPEDAMSYAIDDAHATHAVWAAQEPNREWLGDQYRQARSAFWLHLMSAWGLTTDPRAVAELERTKRSEYDRLARDLVAAGLKRPDRINRKGVRVEGARNTKAVAALLEKAMGAAVPRAPKGGIKTDAETCESSGIPALAAYAEFGGLKKTLSTDIPLLVSGTRVPIQARFEELLESGRTSSSPNVQNLPTTAGVRDCFIPRPGFLFAAADYGGFELCAGAQACIDLVGHSKLAEDLRRGVDPHCVIAASILGMPYEEAKAKHKAGDHAVYLARQTGKVANFGFPGGLGAAAFVAFAKSNYGVVVTQEQAVHLKETWLSSYPEWREYFRWAGKEADAQFAQVKQLRSGRARGGVSFTELCNTMFQGLAADAAKAAGWMIAKACYLPGSVLHGCRIVNFVHDEMILEVPQELGHECAFELARLMEEGARPWMPDAPPKAEPLLMRRWSKKAKPTYVGGRLVPWT